jgi:hypothetical protein
MPFRVSMRISPNLIKIWAGGAEGFKSSHSSSSFIIFFFFGVFLICSVSHIINFFV